MFANLESMIVLGLEDPQASQIIVPEDGTLRKHRLACAADFGLNTQGSACGAISSGSWIVGESGGIGRHARFRIWCRKVWGFESPLSHQHFSKQKIGFQ